MIVKICGITNAEDALAAVDAGARALGLNFYPRSPRYLTFEQASELVRILPEGVWTVGVFVDETAATLREFARRVPLDIVQLHGNCEIPEGLSVWRALAAGPGLDRSLLTDPSIAAHLVETPAGPARGGAGKTFDWNLAAGLPGKVILAGGLDPDNVAEAIRTARPWGVDACSRLESAPGKKDNKKVKAFVENALGVSI